MTTPMKLLTILAVLLASATPASAGAIRYPAKLTCTGVIIQSGGELRLKPDPDEVLWCEAFFKPEIAKRVRTTCDEGTRCRVRGTIREARDGRGAFYWVASVERLSSK